MSELSIQENTGDCGGSGSSRGVGRGGGGVGGGVGGGGRGGGGVVGGGATVNRKSLDCIGAVHHLLIVVLEPLTQQKAENKNLLISFMILTNSSLWQVLNKKHCLI